MPTQNIRTHSRRLTLVPQVGTQILSVDAGANEESTWVAHIQHVGDAPTSVINLDGQYTGPSGTVSTINTELGSREGMAFWFTSAITITAACAQAVAVDVWCTKAMAHIPYPPFRHTQAVTNLAYVPMSPNSGFAPSNRRWFGIMSDARNYDIRIIEGISGTIIWEAVNLAPSIVFRQVLPPGCRLTAKSNIVANALLTATWTQYHSQ